MSLVGMSELLMRQCFLIFREKPESPSQCFSNRVSRHICVLQVFPVYVAKLFLNIILRKDLAFNMKIMVFCLRNVSLKTILWKMFRQPKRVKNHCPKSTCFDYARSLQTTLVSQKKYLCIKVFLFIQYWLVLWLHLKTNLRK